MTQFTIMGASVMARDSIMGASVMAQVSIMGASVMARDSWLQTNKHWMVHVHTCAYMHIHDVRTCTPVTRADVTLDSALNDSTVLEFFRSHSMSLVLTA